MKNISKSFPGVQALDNFDISIKNGEIHCLVGENGSGKSTLIKIISGVIKADPGYEIIINGKRLKKQQLINSTEYGIEVIYQDLSLFPNLTVAENISWNQIIESELKFINWKKVKNIARESMDKIKLKLRSSDLVGDLSIAKRQLIAICRAMTNEAKLIIMDEPTSSLTKNEVDLLLSVIKNLVRKGISVLFVSHKLNEIFEVADIVTVIRDGRKIGTFDIRELNIKKLAKLMVGDDFLSSQIKLPDYKKDKILLEVQDLSKKNNFTDINLKLYPGEILSITGLLGSGRTELALSLFGLNTPDEGKIIVEGNLVKINTSNEAIRLGINYIPEDRLTQSLFMEQSVGKNIIITIIKKLLSKLGLLSSKMINNSIESSIDQLKIITPSMEVPVKQLSGGNQQRVVLAKWLKTNPKILIIDGPTVGIDVHAKDKIYNIIKDLAAKGIGIIIISDEVQEILKNTHRILLMKKGKIICEFISQNSDEDEILRILNAKNKINS